MTTENRHFPRLDITVGFDFRLNCGSTRHTSTGEIAFFLKTARIHSWDAFVRNLPRLNGLVTHSAAGCVVFTEARRPAKGGHAHLCSALQLAVRRAAIPGRVG